eukprot:scaffold2611_cov133-Skeletonema_menzelii.AAC.8
MMTTWIFVRWIWIGVYRRFVVEQSVSSYLRESVLVYMDANPHNRGCELRSTRLILAVNAAVSKERERERDH